MASVAFRDMSVADVPSGLRLCRQSGWNQIEADWRLLLEPPSLVRLAVLGDRVVGSAGAVVYGDRMAWVCMVLVDPAERGHGLGTDLVAQVLERLPKTRAVGLDATPQGRPVYERLGFRAAFELGRLEWAPENRAAAAASVRPLAAADLPRVLAEDAVVFGADRGRLLRHALGAAPEYAWCVAGGGSPLAYAFGRHGENADQVGPVVAPAVPQARALVSACLAGARRRVFLDAPAWPEWRANLAELGFREQRTFTRMYRDGREPDSRPGSSFAILGPEFA